MSSKSPFADFYDNVFASSDPKSQADFLRQLFTKDASLCASYYSFVMWLPMEHEIEHLKKQTVNKTQLLREKTIHFDWEELYDLDPTADTYEYFLTDWINRKLINDHLLRMNAHCRNGELLNAIAELRIIESGLNLDWTQVEEPASYYGEAVMMEIGYHFDHFTTCFMDGIFCDEMIEEGIKMAEEFKSDQGEFFDHSKNWMDIMDTMLYYLKQKQSEE